MTVPLSAWMCRRRDWIWRCVLTGKRWSVDNDEAGIKLLVKQLKPYPGALVVMEATGGFELAAAAAVIAAGFEAAIVNPRQVRDFGGAVGQLAKTDTIDADLVALFGERVRPEPRPLPDEDLQVLQALMARRRQMIEMLTMEKNRVSMARATAVQLSLKRNIEWLEKQLSDVDRELGDAIKQSPIWRAKENLLKSVPEGRPDRKHHLPGPPPRARLAQPPSRSRHWSAWRRSPMTAEATAADV